MTVIGEKQTSGRGAPEWQSLTPVIYDAPPNEKG
jgi:hypothetical protein